MMGRWMNEWLGRRIERQIGRKEAPWSKIIWTD
jgi:hypothetical protein